MYVDKFIVQRSNDGVSFESIGEVISDGDLKLNHSYRFIDSRINFSQVKYYYRLISIDIDGLRSISDVISIDVSKLESHQINPNPVSNLLHLDSKILIQSNMKLEIFNISGLLLFEKNYLLHSGDNRNVIDVSMFPIGEVRNESFKWGFCRAIIVHKRVEF